MRIVESFDTIQGEGKHAGVPMHLIRLFGCNLNCEFCDSTHAVTDVFAEITPEELAQHIKGHCGKTFLWTGGEPCLQLDDILDTMSLIWGSIHHLETNGTILDPRLRNFNYIAFSPKDINTAEQVKNFGLRTLTGLRGGFPYQSFEIKVVTDMDSVGRDMLEIATSLMPLTTGSPDRDLEIKKRVWEYCSTHNKRYSPRIHLGVE